MKIKRRRFLQSFSISALGLGIGYSYYETRSLEITRLNLNIGSKIAFLVDTHIHEFGEVEERILELVKKEEPDIILLGGDILDEFTDDFRAVIRYISNLEAREKFAVLGNHDYWSGKAGELAKILKDNKFKILYDSTEQSLIGKIYGLDWRDSRIYSELKAQGIVIVHDPNAAKKISGNCFIMAGHTHGGVVLGSLALLSNSIYVRGLYNLEENVKLYVSKGLGQMFPFRPTSPLELLIIE